MMSESLLALDEAMELEVQEYCQHELEDVLTELRGLVLISEMPERARMRYLAEIEHLRDHLRGETKLLCAQINGRLN